MDIDLIAEEKRFLGEEFLTWLWFEARRSGGVFDLADGRRVEVFFSDFLSMVASDGPPVESSLRRGAPWRSPEARCSFLSGKRVKKAKLDLVGPEGAFEVTIDGRTLDLCGIKTPEPGETHIDDLVCERLHHFMALESIILGLYEMFLELRLTAAWDSELVPDMRRFVEAAPVS